MANFMSQDLSREIKKLEVRLIEFTRQEKVIANTSIKCGALQGNWFIMEDLLLMKAEGQTIVVAS